MNAASAAAASVVLPQAPASAFANAVPEAAKYADRKKRRGPAPQNLGLKNREADGADVEVLEARFEIVVIVTDAELIEARRRE